MARNNARSGLALVALWWALGCGPEARYHGLFSQNPAACDDALRVMCGCSSVDCSPESADPTVVMLRRCQQREVPFGEFETAVCIALSQDYCTYHEAATRGTGPVCQRGCVRENACEHLQACERFVYAQCSLSDGGLGP